MTSNDPNCILEKHLKPFQRLAPFAIKRLDAGAIIGTLALWKSDLSFVLMNTEYRRFKTIKVLAIEFN